MMWDNGDMNPEPVLDKWATEHVSTVCLGQHSLLAPSTLQPAPLQTLQPL